MSAVTSLADETLSHLEDHCSSVCDGLGLEVICLRPIQDAHGAALQLFIERRDGQPVALSDCTQVSRGVTAVIDEANPEVLEHFGLQVSSPGLERPLVRPGHYERFCGSRARIHTKDTLGGRRKFVGTLRTVHDESVVLEVDSGLVHIPLQNIRKANLMAEDVVTKTRA